MSVSVTWSISGVSDTVVVLRIFQLLLGAAAGQWPWPPRAVRPAIAVVVFVPAVTAADAGKVDGAPGLVLLAFGHAFHAWLSIALSV